MIDRIAETIVYDFTILVLNLRRKCQVRHLVRPVSESVCIEVNVYLQYLKKTHGLWVVCHSKNKHILKNNPPKYKQTCVLLCSILKINPVLFGTLQTIWELHYLR